MDFLLFWVPKTGVRAPEKTSTSEGIFSRWHIWKNDFTPRKSNSSAAPCPSQNSLNVIAHDRKLGIEHIKEATRPAFERKPPAQGDRHAGVKQGVEDVL
jgi:hypothetical protein